MKKKKNTTQIDIYWLIRKEWLIKPTVRIKPSKKVYSRKNYKLELD